MRILHRTGFVEGEKSEKTFADATERCMVRRRPCTTLRLALGLLVSHQVIGGLELAVADAARPSVTFLTRQQVDDGVDRSEADMLPRMHRHVVAVPLLCDRLGLVRDGGTRACERLTAVPRAVQHLRQPVLRSGRGNQ